MYTRDHDLLSGRKAQRGRGHAGTEEPHRCAHAGPLLAEPVAEGGPYRAKCLLCGASGPERDKSSGAAQALRKTAKGK